MKDLWVTTIIWSFSFALIGNYLAGKVDSYYAVSIRFGLAMLVCLPFLKFKKKERGTYLKLGAIGAVQVGLMYLCFYKSFLYLPVPVVIMFTSFTPLYIGIYHSARNKDFSAFVILPILLAVIGAVFIRWSFPGEDFLVGFLLVQAANLAFSVGQLAYRRLGIDLERKGIKDREVFFWFYTGASLFSLPMALLFGNTSRLHFGPAQMAVLLWLGVVASGLGYLLWNRGTRKVSTPLLAIMNNLVVPLGVIVSFLWGSPIKSLTHFIIGSLLILLALTISIRKGR